MSQALYRKYRSRTLDEVVGQKHITDVLLKALQHKRIGHAFLFTGPRGTGKTSIARILAHAINDLPYENDSLHLDIVEIDAASNRRIDDIRDLREKVHIAPTSAPFKVYIIDEVHMLTGESFNALLKTLEEPPAHVVFILATTEAHKLPATIVSRTQRFHFRLIPEAEVAKHLSHIAEQENIKIDEDALELIAEHGEGSFRDSISLLDQLGSVAGDEHVTAKMIESTLGLAPRARVEKLIELTEAHDIGGATKLLDNLEKVGTSPTVLVNQLLKALRIQEPPTTESFALAEALLEVPRSHNPQMKLLAIIAKFAGQGEPTPPKAAPAAELSSKTAALAAPVAPSISSPLAETIKNFSWEKVIETIHGKYAPLHSVLRHATAVYASGGLTLYFTYSLHRKKIEDSKYRTALITAITQIYGACPDITTVIGTPPPKDETAAAVAEVMGGGEEIDVEK
ncbi:DNA polymerase III, subunits gamma and tau [candidate division TM7 genomosp. GTL1]|nr:DNA polymerase III, subunits gamma and tau [candidate division TM7 genomosp. GTL1]